MFHVLLDPKANVTFFATDSLVYQDRIDAFLRIAEAFKGIDLPGIHTSQLYLQMLPGGYCPQFFSNNVTLNSFLGEDMNTTKLLNFASSKNGSLIITNANGETTPSVFVDTACFSTVYRLEEIINEFTSIEEVQSGLKPDPYEVAAIPLVESSYGIEPTCENRNIIQTYPGFVTADTNTNTSDSGGLGTGAIVGIVLGSIAGVALAAVAALFLMRKKKAKSDADGRFNEFMKSVDSLKTWPTVEMSTSSDITLPPVPFSESTVHASELEFVKDPVSGERVFLGSGRFAKVFEGLLHGAERVAVKCINSDYLESSYSSSAATTASKSKSTESGTESGSGSRPQGTIHHERVLREVSLLKACRSQHIVSFIGVCFSKQEVQLVTELMEGGNLFKALQSGKISWYNGGYDIACDVLAGLVYLHNHRVVHLDLKSSNILLKHPVEDTPTKYIAKIGDVGVSRIIPLSTEYLTTVGGIGTWHWSAPEVILGVKCSPAADVWSMGTVLWEICSREPPMRGQMRTLKVPEECPQEVADIIERCWAPNPSNRPTSVELFKELKSRPVRQDL